MQFSLNAANMAFLMMALQFVMPQLASWESAKEREKRKRKKNNENDSSSAIAYMAAWAIHNAKLQSGQCKIAIV